MDNLTHTLTGLMLSRAGLNRFHARATLILMVAANVPDADAISAVGGAAAYFEHHRWFTHAILATPAMALLPVLLVRLLSPGQPFRWLSAWAISMAGVCSHLLLDFTNPYGIRLFLPFNPAWPMLSITSVIDLWIWAALILAACAPLLGRLVSAEIGAKPGGIGRGWALTALLFLATYNGGRAVLHSRAIDLQESRMYDGESPRRVLAYPTSINPFVWDGVVETGAFFRKQTVDVTSGIQSSGARTIFKTESSEAIEATARTSLFRHMAEFSKALVWHTYPVSEPEGGVRVEASDVYFGFTAAAVLNSKNEVQSTRFYFSR